MAEMEVRGRLHISKETAKNAKGAARTTVQLLGVATQMTQGVPYLGAVSAALTEFIKIQDVSSINHAVSLDRVNCREKEVDVCKEECKESMYNARQINDMIKRVRDESTGREGALNPRLQLAFADLERVVLESIGILAQCKVDKPGVGARLRLYARRVELGKSVQGCTVRLNNALLHFNTVLQVNQSILLEDIRDTVNKIHDGPPTPHKSRDQRAVRADNSRSPAPGIMQRHSATLMHLEPKPFFFCGRDNEVLRIVRDVTRQGPSGRIAILGTGGIGKTSIALSVLHHPSVEARYMNRRYFVSCVAITSADDLWQELHLVFGVSYDGVNPRGHKASFRDRRHDDRLLSKIMSADAIICLDNFETPSKADTAETESLLIELASIECLALLITSRLTDTPLIEWSYPRLDPIAPLTVESSLELWNNICHGYDGHSRKLVEAVDCLPLAVTLLARLARTETSEVIWARWQTEKTNLLSSTGKGHRLNNLGISIELSLRALGDQSAIDLLRVLSIFPKGLLDCYIPRWENAFKDSLSVRKSITLLKQHSMIQSVKQMKPRSAQTAADTDAFASHEPVEVIAGIRVLSPIRHHMLNCYPISNGSILCLVHIYCDLSKNCIPSDLDNTSIFFDQGLARNEIREHCLQAMAETHKSTCYLFYPQKLLIRAVEVARSHGSSTERALSLRLAIMWKHKFKSEKAFAYEKAQVLIRNAIILDQDAWRMADEIEDWTELAWLHVEFADWLQHGLEVEYTDFTTRQRECLWEAETCLGMIEELMSKSTGSLLGDSFWTAAETNVNTNALRHAITGRTGRLINSPTPRAAQDFASYSMEPAAVGISAPRGRVIGFSIW
ncbi:hypothetical protein PENSPDRAFT_680781 [Peniophora sp. CONT]|nr:hypothetical protein PENSPDRAFT_680781 [Peniophora sp. CONT]